MNNVTRELAELIRASNIATHKLEAPFYDAIHPEIFGSHEQHQIDKDLELIANILGNNSPIQVLDVGCGTGNLTLKFLKRGWNVKAIDLSPEMLSKLLAKCGTTISSQLQVATIDALEAVSNPTSFECYDLVSFGSVLHHLPAYDSVLLLALKQLRQGGLLWVCHEPLKTEPRYIPWAHRLATATIDFLDMLYIYALKLFVYSWHSAHTLTPFRRIDYKYSDYHAPEGINAPALLRLLSMHGAIELLYTTYRCRYSTFLHILDTRLHITQHRHFSFLVRRA